MSVTIYSWRTVGLGLKISVLRADVADARRTPCTLELSEVDGSVTLPDQFSLIPEV
jgi:hypothetical protein